MKTSVRVCWLSAVVFVVCGFALPGAAEEARYGVGDWSDALGNHRVRLRVADKADAVWAHIPWRRRDARPELKDIVVIDAATKQRVKNVLRVAVGREAGDLLFQPATAPGEYEVYYLPFKYTGSPYFPTVVYTRPENTADAAWANSVKPLAARITAGKTADIAKAVVMEIQAINDFHRFDPMEVIASAEEMKALRAAHPQPCLLFSEDRRYPIRMTTELPLRWIKSGPRDTFSGEACRGEFYAFQIGVYAVGQDVDNLRVGFAPLKSEKGDIAAEAMRCFNQGGIDWLGRPFRKTVRVAKGHVQPLWIGVQVAPDAAAGVYHGDLTLTADNLPASKVQITLTVTDKLLADAGDGELWRHARLRWLDSKIGLDDEVTAPYSPVAVVDNTVSVLGRRAHIAPGGLFDSIQSTFGYSVDRVDAPAREVLAAPLQFVVETGAGPVAWSPGEVQMGQPTPGAVSWEAVNKTDALELHCQAKMECDGYVNFRLTLHAMQPQDLRDMRLEIPLRRDVASYMMGLGCKGGLRPSQWQWKWDVNRANSQLWLGDVNAGLNCKLKHIDDRWDIYNMKECGPYRDWSNDGCGGCNVAEDSDQVVIRAYTGPRKLAAGEKLHFNFGLLITPVKTLDKNHWQWRYSHSGGALPVPEVIASGATLINLHHGVALNPYINYPFQMTTELAAYVREAHAQKLKVKLYYTVRELSSYVAEFWALRSLGNEVFSNGPGFHLADQFAPNQTPAPATPTGSSWLCEHAVSDYAPAWHQPLGNGRYDAAVATAGLSRWHNYYLEGLSWLVRTVGIDGLYLDGIGYDREIMKRVRKVLDRAKPGCLIDFHSGNNFHPDYGLSNCANQYMELFPFIDSLWFGEGFDYNESPAYWLVEISGIPYGLFGEMLQGGGNPWRGMLYGMSNRIYQGRNPGPLWKLWDVFGIQQARMIGYWDPACPVKTDRADVLATAYVRDGKTLIALASWAPAAVKCKLQIDWAALHLDPAKVRLVAPAVEGIQTAAEFAPTAEIPVEPGRGWLFVLQP